MLTDNIQDKPSNVRKLLVIDSSYSLEIIRSRGLENSVTCRDLNGFFEHVWTVHPFATLVTSDEWTSRYGKLEVYSLAPAHTFIEGKVGKFPMLRALPKLNFFLSQINIFVHLVRLIRREKISVVRAGNPHFLGFFGWGLSRLCGIPLVIRVAANYDLNYTITGDWGSPKLFPARWIEKIIERFVLKRSGLVACPSKNYIDFSLANGAKPESTVLFRYGNLIDKKHLVDPRVRPDGATLLEELGLKNKRFLLNIGRLVKLKCPDHVVRILAELRLRGYDIKAVLVGDGSFREELIALAGELGLEEQVLFCGNRDQQWLATIIPHATAVISPITGRALSEAAFGAAPIVAYDLDWQGELIQTGKTGELVPQFKWKNMADSVEKFLTNPEYARLMGDAVRRQAFEMLDPEKLDQYERNAYLKLLGVRVK